ncbi:MAG TPA: hypothetical protein VKB40_04775 [Candidatus Acidoferrales bacterium]|nr:hypothetical protein [Candidatus Acidoferrales bacterium]
MAHISGTVHLRAIIAKDGSVRELEVVDGNPLLAQAAKASPEPALPANEVERWKWKRTSL